MRIYPCLLVMISICLLASPSSGQTNQQELPMYDELADIQQALFNDRFAEALALCSLVVQNNPDHPAGYSFLTATMMAQMTDHEEYIYGDQFEKLIDTTIILSERMLKEQSPYQKAWTCLWKGNAFAYKALYASRFGSFFTAARYGMKAKGSFQDGLHLDSTNYDLLVGLGSYHYWKSAKAGFLRWVGIFKNQKELGIDELRLAHDSASLFSEAARRAMVWIWLNEEEYDSVIVAARELEDRYPQGKAVLWPMAEALLKLKRYDDAALVYLKLRDQLALEPGNYYNLIECDYLLCETYKKLSEDQKAIEVAAYLNEYDDLIPEQTRKRQKKRLKHLKRMNQ